MPLQVFMSQFLSCGFGIHISIPIQDTPIHIHFSMCSGEKSPESRPIQDTLSPWKPLHMSLHVFLCQLWFWNKSFHTHSRHAYSYTSPVNCSFGANFSESGPIPDSLSLWRPIHVFLHNMAPEQISSKSGPTPDTPRL